MCPEATEQQPIDTGPGRAEVGPNLVLPAFEGPLDLLLHLIRINEISNTDIPIQEICRQYDAYLGLMKEMNLAIAGEYFVMASTLIHIKSRMLLPADPAAPGEAPEDPRAELVRQLLEYQRVSAAAEVLRERGELQDAVFTRGHAGEDPLAPFRNEELLEVSLFDLLSAFKRLAESLGDDTPLHVERDEISVAEKISWILEKLAAKEVLHFDRLILGLPARRERIAVFLAILELIRLQLIRVSQHRVRGEILIRPPAPDDPDATTEEGSRDPGN